MTTHAIAKLYHYTQPLNFYSPSPSPQCNACWKCEKNLGAVIPTWSPGGEEWRPSDRLDRRRKS